MLLFSLFYLYSSVFRFIFREKLFNEEVSVGRKHFLCYYINSKLLYLVSQNVLAQTMQCFISMRHFNLIIINFLFFQITKVSLKTKTYKYPIFPNPKPFLAQNLKIQRTKHSLPERNGLQQAELHWKTVEQQILMSKSSSILII